MLSPKVNSCHSLRLGCGTTAEKLLFSKATVRSSCANPAANRPTPFCRRSSSKPDDGKTSLLLRSLDAYISNAAQILEDKATAGGKGSSSEKVPVQDEVVNAKESYVIEYTQVEDADLQARTKFRDRVVPPPPRVLAKPENRLHYFRGICKDTLNVEHLWNTYLSVVRDSSTLKELTRADFRHVLVRLRNYPNVRRLDRAREVLHQMERLGMERQAFEWNTELDILVLQGHYEEAIKYYQEGIEAGRQPNKVTYWTLVRAAANHQTAQDCANVFQEMKDKGFSPDAFAYANLAKAYAKEGNMSEMLKTISEAENDTSIQSPCPVRNLVARSSARLHDADTIMALLSDDISQSRVPSTSIYNYLMEVYIERDDIASATAVFNEMKRHQVPHDATTYSFLIRSYTKQDEYKKVENLWHAMIKRNACALTLPAYKSVLSMYARLKKMKEMERWLGHLRKSEAGAIDGTVIKIFDQAYYHAEDPKAFARFLHSVRDAKDSNFRIGTEPYLNVNLGRALNNNNLNLAEWYFTICRLHRVSVPPRSLLRLAERAAEDGRSSLAARCLLFIRQIKDQETEFKDQAARVVSRIVPTLELDQYIRISEMFHFMGLDIKVNFTKILDMFRTAAQAGTLLPAIDTYNKQNDKKIPLTRQLRSFVFAALLEHDLKGARIYAATIDTPEVVDDPKSVIVYRAKSVVNRMVNAGEYRKASKALELLGTLRISADAATCASIIKGLFKEAPPEGVDFYFKPFMKQLAPESQRILLYNAFLNGYADQGDDRKFHKYWVRMYMDPLVEANSKTYGARMRLFARLGDQNRLEKDLDFMEEKQIPVDKGTWRALIATFLEREDIEGVYRLLRRFKTSGQNPHVDIYIPVISFHQTKQQYEQMRQLFEDFVELGGQPTPIMYQSLLTAAARQGRGSKAEDLLRDMAKRGIEPDLYNFTAVLSAHAAEGNAEGALACYQRILDSGMQPSLVTDNALLAALAHAGDVPAVHQHLSRLQTKWGRQELDVSTLNALWRSFAMAGKLDQMYEYFSAYAKHPATLENGQKEYAVIRTLLIGHCRAGDVVGAAKQFQVLIEAGLVPDVKIYSAMIEACARNGDLLAIGEWVGRAESAGVVLDAVTASIAADSLVKAQRVSDAVSLIQRMQNKGVKLDAAVYTSLLAHYSQAGNIDGLDSVLKSMTVAKVEPSLSTWTTCMSGFSRGGRHEDALNIWAALRGDTVAREKYGMSMSGPPLQTSDIPGALLSVVFDVFGFAGRAEDARALWKVLQESEVAWNENHLASYVECLARLGHIDEGLALVKAKQMEMSRVGSKTCLALLSFLLKSKRMGDAKKFLSWVEKRKGAWFVEFLGQKYPQLMEDVRAGEPSIWQRVGWAK
ncbi:hypothetical protein DFS34DRAFT_651100 [Phlyctochytrium arcticum]|nr:hypothetical protein DFS34DRAFT_651100 [Phlyctochytrium arcticum]